MIRTLRTVGLVALAGLFGCSASGDEKQDEVLQCCMLKQLASHCTPATCYPTLGGTCSAPSQSLLDRIEQWRRVGNTGDGDACKALIDSADNGCFGDIDYGERDAIVACS
jgi:hypothetical protein